MSFDFKKYMSAINYTKEMVFDPDDDYSSFLINRNFSYFPDTLFYAYDIASHSHLLPDSMHFLYWVDSIQSRKRYTKFHKKTDLKAVPAICWMYKVNKKHAENYLDCLSETEVKYIMDAYQNR